MKACFAMAACGLASLSLSGSLSAQITLDGSLDAAYGSAVSVQTVQTNFGDNFSELDAAYVNISGGNLILLVTGNLEGNFNKLNIFIDSVAGGQNVIGPATDEGGVNPNNDDWAENYSGVGPAASANGPGFRFDAGFEADYLLINRHNGSSTFDLDFSSVGNTSVVDTNSDVFGGTNTGSVTGLGSAGLGFAFDNSNAAGIAGGTGAADPVAAAGVITGLEYSIPLSAIGNPSPGDQIRFSAHVTGSNHDFLSNQSLGGFAAPQDNLGGDGAGNFNNDVSLVDHNLFTGSQFFSVTVPAAVPEPGTLSLLTIGSLAGLARRRRV